MEKFPGFRRIELQRKRRERGMSSQETYQSLKNLSGPDLLSAPPVADVLTYASDWDPFIVNKIPKVKQDEDLKIDRFSGEIALPYPYIIPSLKRGKESQWGNQQFYWDMYFINKALLTSGRSEYVQQAIHHVENFQYLFDRLGYIPNASQLAIVNRTQIPFLTGMIRDIYQVTQDKGWLKEKMDFAKREYGEVWTFTADQKLKKGIRRQSHRINDTVSLIRPVGTDVVKEHYVAAGMTGEDDSSQWAGRAYEVLPVGLNTALYKYESDFAYAAGILGDTVEEQKWNDLAEKRKQEINAFFWDSKKGMYFDASYNRDKKVWEKDIKYYALTGFMPLWVGLASQEQADALMSHLPKFETPYGLMVAPRKSSSSEHLSNFRTRMALGLGITRRYLPAINDLFEQKQWDYPNIWAPTEYFAIDGMLRYGKTKDANRIMENILRSLASFYQQHGTLPEKIDGTTGNNGKNFQYPDQEGFGWTNALVGIIRDRLHQSNPLH